MIDDTSNQLLAQAVVLLTHEASKLESFPHSHAFNGDVGRSSCKRGFSSVEVELCYL